MGMRLPDSLALFRALHTGCRRPPHQKQSRSVLSARKQRATSGFAKTLRVLAAMRGRAVRISATRRHKRPRLAPAHPRYVVMRGGTRVKSPAKARRFAPGQAMGAACKIQT